MRFKFKGSLGSTLSDSQCRPTCMSIVCNIVWVSHGGCCMCMGAPSAAVPTGFCCVPCWMFMTYPLQQAPVHSNRTSKLPMQASTSWIRTLL